MSEVALCFVGERRGPCFREEKFGVSASEGKRRVAVTLEAHWRSAEETTEGRVWIKYRPNPLDDTILLLSWHAARGAAAQVQTWATPP